jgi:uncharacterized protein
MILVGYGLAVLIGVSLGLLGGGGSILTVPVLLYVFQVGVKEAIPMSLVVVGLTSLVGVFRHRRAGHVRLDAALTIGPMAIVGALLGSVAGLRVSGRLQLTAFAIIMLLAAVLMLRSQGDVPASGRRRPLPLLAALGVGVGFLTGFLGVGGGFLYVPALALLAGLDMKSAVGTSLAMIALSCAAGVVGYLGKVPLDWGLIASFTAMAFVGVALGSAIVPHVSQHALRRGFAVFILAIGVLVLIRGEGRTRGTRALDRGRLPDVVGRSSLVVRPPPASTHTSTTNDQRPVTNE